MAFSSTPSRGFTLVELLVVIGIIAILAVVVVLIINPARLFRAARDAQRISDFATLRRAIDFTIITGAPALQAGPNVTSGSTCGFLSGCGTPTLNNTYAVDGTGWVGADFRTAAGGSPLARLPRDPTNAGNFFYAWKSNGSTNDPLYELNLRFEGTQTIIGGACPASDTDCTKYKGLEENDGGDASDCSFSYNQSTCYYEVGNSLSL
jgi:prepilin-type N-terminal cleavage/methylation domain-containing protein